LARMLTVFTTSLSSKPTKSDGLTAIAIDCKNQEETLVATNKTR